MMSYCILFNIYLNVKHTDRKSHSLNKASRNPLPVNVLRVSVLTAWSRNHDRREKFDPKMLVSHINLKQQKIVNVQYWSYVSGVNEYKG